MPSLVGASKLQVSCRKAAGKSSFFMTRSGRVTSCSLPRPRLGWAAPLVTLGPAWATSCSQGSCMGPVLTLQGLLVRPGSWAGSLSGPLSSSSSLVTSEGGRKGRGSRGPGLAASCQEEGVGGPRPCLHLRPPRPASHIPARGARPLSPSSTQRSGHNRRSQVGPAWVGFEPATCKGRSET